MIRNTCWGVVTRGGCPKTAPRHTCPPPLVETAFCTPRSLRERPSCLIFPARKSRGLTGGPPTCANAGCHTAPTGKRASDFKHEGRFRSERGGIKPGFRRAARISMRCGFRTAWRGCVLRYGSSCKDGKRGSREESESHGEDAANGSGFWLRHPGCDVCEGRADGTSCVCTELADRGGWNAAEHRCRSYSSEYSQVSCLLRYARSRGLHVYEGVGL